MLGNGKKFKNLDDSLALALQMGGADIEASKQALQLHIPEHPSAPILAHLPQLYEIDLAFPLHIYPDLHRLDGV